MKEAEVEIARKLRRLRRRITLAMVISLVIVLLVPSYVYLGMFYSGEASEPSLFMVDFSAVPQPVIEDATSLANELFKNSPEKNHDFVSQLLRTYLEAEDKDFVMVFNSGGWGWKLLEPATQWHSISTGIQAELNNSGYNLLCLEYQRTSRDFHGYLDEILEMLTLYPSKARELAARVKFLTRHNPHLKVILAGESNGSVIVNSVMDRVGENPQVYCIQTGPPFWLKNTYKERELILTNNGLVPDTFSRGDIFSMAATSLEDLLGFPRPEDMSGNILYYVGAPGHDYRWDYPNVYSQISDFIHKNFGVEWP